MSQFRALSQKNWILWKRNLCGNITQLVIPIFFMCFVILVRMLIEVQQYQQGSYISNNDKTFYIYGQRESIGYRNLNFKNTCPGGSVIALSPTGNSLETSLKNQLILQGYTVEQFTSDSQIDAHIRSVNYGTTLNYICFGISIVQSTLGGAYKYKLRFNESSDQYQSDGPGTTGNLMLDFALNIQLFENTIYNGMIGTTNFVNNVILQTQVDTNHVIKSIIAPIYQQYYEKDVLYDNTRQNVGMWFLLPLLILYLRQTSTMLFEKQKKIRQTMKIMGMNVPLYYFTWFIRYFMVYLVIHIIGSFIVSRTLIYIPFIIPFVLFILFDILLIIQSFFIQTFFSNSKIGVVIGLLFFLVQYLLSLISSNSNNPTQQLNRYISIVPHAAFVLAFQTILYAQSVKKVLTFNEMLKNYTISTAVISFAVNIVLWLILTWYFEQVFPNQFGTKKHPLFCLLEDKSLVQQQNKKMHTSSQIYPQQSHQTAQIQQVDQKFKLQQAQQKIIKIQNLCKQFNGDFIAVNNLNIKMYNDNIFVLLGHNGAGKTTTISMLTGMLEPTSGKIQVLGQTQMNKIRQKIGICPQHDTLYDDMTVKQHLELFGTFRGLNSQEIQQQVNKLIADVNLAEKQNQYSKNLSGGQKRRLSVAMAFAGRSKVIILDEPTSGMDTSARRYIWELLKSYKSDRIILLTTHFMDEADYLGDRIGIMAGGKLMCCGSGHYLKNKFGVGYNITFVKKTSQTSSDQIVKVVKKHVSRANILSDVSSQITMQLPMDEIKKFPELFNQIDAKKDSLGISTYGISITTLEQVFLKVGEQNEKDQKQQENKNQKINEEIDSPNIQKKKKKKSKKKLKTYDISLMKKQLQTTNNQLQSSKMQSSQNIQRIDGCCHRFLIHFWATILKRLRVIKRDYKSFILQLLLPMAIIIMALLLMRISFIKQLPERQLNFNLYKSQSNPLVIPIGSSDATLRDGIQTVLNTKYGAGISVAKDSVSGTAGAFDSSFLKSKKQAVQFLLGGIYFQPIVTQQLQNMCFFTTLTNTRIPTSFLYLPTLAIQSYINSLFSKSVSISIIQSPFPLTYTQSQLNNTISGFFGSLIFTIAFAFKFSSIISFIVKQREDKSKHQQIVSGMNIYAYWMGNFFYDFILYAFLAGFAVGMCIVLDAKTFIGEALGVVIVTFIMYGLAYIPMTYIMAYFFKDYGNAQAGYYFFTFVIGGLIPIIVLVFRFIDGIPHKVGIYLSWIFKFIPAFCFGQNLLNLGSISFLSTLELGPGNSYSPWDLNITFSGIYFFIGQFIFYTTFLLLLEAIFNNENIMRCLSSQSSIQQTRLSQIQDTDVINMRLKALNANPQEYQILTKDLRKVYILDSQKKYKVAVDNLSVAIEKGEVFGLLGVNGAGKTTTFKMLAGEITSTSGDSYFNGVKISQNLLKVRQNLGYCPQFDALIQNLTVRQQIQLFYDLKSLPKEYKNELVSQKIKQMDLQRYEDKLSGTLSGGNKRKLSVAMAMIGNPSIIFLDQPSTGMDPKARRFMWKIISRIASQKKQSTIILTTHSMQQAQALSTKLSIMVNGQFKCIGTPQHIKSKYGQGYELQIKIVPCSKNQIKEFIIQNKLQTKQFVEKKQFEEFMKFIKADGVMKEIKKDGAGSYIYNLIEGNKRVHVYQIFEFVLLSKKINNINKWMEEKFTNSQVIQNFQTFIRIKVNAKISVGKIFQLLQTEKDKIQIQSYSIKQATVEQIFNKFAQDGQLSEIMG